MMMRKIQSPETLTHNKRMSPVEPFTMHSSPATSSPASSAADAASPASSFNSSGEVNISNTSTPQLTPTTSPMGPNDHNHQRHTYIHSHSKLHSSSRYESKNNEHRDNHDILTTLQLDDYNSEDEKMWGTKDDDDDDDDDDDEAPSLQGSPMSADMMSQLRNMGFRETIARAATEHCTDVSVAVQYACDHPISKRKHEDSASFSSFSTSSSSSHVTSTPSRQTNSYSSKTQDASPLSNLDAESVRSWKVLATDNNTNTSAVPRSSSTSSTSTTSTTSSTSTCATTTCSPCVPSTYSSSSIDSRTKRQQQLAKKLLSIGFQNHEVDAAVLRCNSTPAAARYIMDGGVKGWETKTADVSFECAICMDDDLTDNEMVTLDCLHRFCKNCVTYHLTSLLDTHQIKENQMTCPIPGCEHPVALPIIQDLITKSDYDRLLELKLRKEYASEHVEVRTCPKCEYMVIIEEILIEEDDEEKEEKEEKENQQEDQQEGKQEGQQEGQQEGVKEQVTDGVTKKHKDIKGGKKKRGKGYRRAAARLAASKSKTTQKMSPKKPTRRISVAEKNIQKLLDSLECLNKECKHKFCGRCGLAPHQRQEDQDISCQDFAAFCEANDASNEIFEEYLRENKMKRCPKCLLPAELKSGCNFIRCVCKSSYCYLCGRGLEENMHYSHYHKGPYGKKCHGGKKDKRGHIAQPACEKCDGKDCIKCSESIELTKKNKLERIQANREKYGNNRRGGLMGWFNKKFGKDRRK